MGLYYRIAAYVASVRRLDAPTHFQAIAAAARSVFELSLDIALLSSDQTNESVDRLAAFTQVERYRVARNLVNFYASRPIPANLPLDAQRQLCADPAATARVEGLKQQYWGGNWPRHWSRFPAARGRARQVGPAWEERYVRYYSTLSWHIHSGVVGASGLSQEAFDVFVAEAHRLIVDSVIDSYVALGRELHLARAMAEWDQRLAFLQHVGGLTLVDLRLQELGEPARFLYLEEHEDGATQN